VQIAICHGVHAASQPRATLAFGLAQKAGYTVKPTTKSDSRTSVTREQQPAGFIKKFDFENAALIRSVRRVLRKRMASANELVYDNYNFFVIGYCSTERPSDCIVSIAACAHGVALSFYYGASLLDPKKLLIGSGEESLSVGETNKKGSSRR
jgi:hypothetical protein